MVDQELEGTGLRPLSKPRHVLGGSLVAYLAIATAISISQIGYVNADFVGYSTVAHCLLQDPRTSVTGYWSPLYSWCIAPLIYLGMDDLIAGRMVLVAGGAIYLLAVFGVVCRSHGADERRNRMVSVAVMTAAVLQAATWATTMLDPDLLADGLLFCYFYAVLDPLLPQRPFRALLGGAVAGLAFFGKAYMLPFISVHLAVTILMRWWMSRRSGQGLAIGRRGWGTTWIAFLVGQAAIAGPWIAVLTSHYGKFTSSTAGAANHANMGPTAFGNDPLWNPGLAADFIADPHFGPDWTPWQDREHFLQQLKVIGYNLKNCIGYVVPWVVFGGIFAAIRRANRRRPGSSQAQASPFAPRKNATFAERKATIRQLSLWRSQVEKAVSSEEFPGVWWCVMTVALYCGGYSLINLESRYIVPAITPILCLGAMLIVTGTVYPTEDGLDGIRPRWRELAQWLVPVILLVACQDVIRLANIPLSHPQSVRLARFRSVAKQLRSAGILPKPFASSRWHGGLFVSYAVGNVSEYLGAHPAQRGDGPDRATPGQPCRGLSSLAPAGRREGPAEHRR